MQHVPCWRPERVLSNSNLQTLLLFFHHAQTIGATTAVNGYDRTSASCDAGLERVISVRLTIVKAVHRAVALEFYAFRGLEGDEIRAGDIHR